MTEKHKTIIRSNFAKLVNLNAESVMVPLVTKGILTFNDRECINSATTSQRKAEELLALLVKREDRGFYVLIDALQQSGNPELARLLN